MRIIGGKFRHRLIKAPVIHETRATKDRVREAIFSALGPTITDAIVLDLFAGSGSFGLEALSRGAKHAIMADHNDICVKTIHDNITALEVSGATVWLHDYHETLNRLSRENIKPDLVFLDPPYLDKICETIITELLDRQLMSTKDIIVTETLKDLRIEEEKFTKVRRYRYGITRVTILWR